MIRTHGLSHISLAVSDLDRTLRFYEQAFGVKEYVRDEQSIQVLGPGDTDVLAFELDTENAGRTGGVRHFGFRLVDAADIDRAVDEVERAGGRLLRRGDFGSREYPFAYVADPDGYEIELWFE